MLKEKLTEIKKLLVNSKKYAIIGLMIIILAATTIAVDANTNIIYIEDGDKMHVVYTTSENQEAVEALIPYNVDNTLSIFGGVTGGIGNLVILRPFNIDIVDAGVTTSYLSLNQSVETLLKTSGIELGDMDTVSPSLDSIVDGGTEIVITRVSEDTFTETETKKYDTVYQESSTYITGYQKILTSGVSGERVSTYKNTVVNGVITETELVSVTTTVNSVTQVVLRGTGTATGSSISPLSPPAGFELDENGLPVNYVSVMTSAETTAYTAPDGKGTATGVEAQVGYVAVDPKKIPYGTKLYIVSANGKYVYGYAIANDTGGALLRGEADVDIFLDTSQECIQFGRRNMVVYILS